MKHTNLQQNKGFGLVAVVVLVAVLAIGGGAYYSVKNNTDINNKNATSTAEVDMRATSSHAMFNASTTLNVETRGTLRSLMGMDSTMKCTIVGDKATGNTGGVVYIENETKMRGDFTTKMENGSVVESHMIRNGDVVYVWSGTQGAKLSVSQATDASVTSKAGVNLDSEVNYTCTAWTKDESKFTVPTNVTFYTMADVLKSGIKGFIKGSTN